MILVKYFPLYSKLCLMASLLESTHFRLSVSSRNLTISHHFDRSKKDIKFFVATLLVILTISQFFSKTHKTPLQELVIAWIGNLILLTGIVYLYVFRRSKPNEIILFINSLFQFNSLHPCIDLRSSFSLRVKISVFFVQCTLFTAYIFPVIFIYGIHWSSPCKISLFGYWLLKQCSQSPDNLTLIEAVCDKLTKIVVFLMNHWMWSFTIYSTIFGLTVILTLSLICLYDFIERYYNFINI